MNNTKTNTTYRLKSRLVVQIRIRVPVIRASHADDTLNLNARELCLSRPPACNASRKNASPNRNSWTGGSDDGHRAGQPGSGGASCGRFANFYPRRERLEANAVRVRTSSTSKCTILDPLTASCRTLKGPTRSRIFCSILVSSNTSISK